MKNLKPVNAMKRILLLSPVVLLAAFFLSGCIRNDVPVNVNENYWLSKERGEVVYSDPYCSYYVVETYYGYTIIRAWGGYKPYEGSLLYGDFGYYGSRQFYDRSTRTLISGEVVEYDLSYVDAQYAIEYYCPYAKGAQIRESTTSGNKATRPARSATDQQGNE